MTDGKDLKGALQHELDRLAGARDELKVQLKLAQSEAGEEWNKLEQKWVSVQDEIKRVAEQSREPLHEISHGVRNLLSELEHGYARIRAQLSAPINLQSLQKAQEVHVTVVDLAAEQATNRAHAVCANTTFR